MAKGEASNSITQVAPNKGPLAPKKGPLMIAMALLAVGIGISLYLVHAKVSLENDPNFKSACNFGDKMNCDAVQTSAYSSVFGLPLALYAVPVYFAMLYLAFVGLRSTISRARPRAVETAQNATFGLVGLGLLSIVASLYLAYISTFVIEVFCVFCISMYAVNLGSTGLAIWAGGAGFGGAFRGAVQVAGQFKQPVLSTLGVLLVAFAASVGFQSSLEGQMQASYIENIDELFSDEEFEDEGEPVGVAVNADPTPAATAGSATPATTPATDTKPPSQAGSQAVAPVNNSATKPDATGVTYARSPRKPKAKKTENGLSYFEMPIYENDWAKGPVDAPVTVVKIADFECGYCRILHLNMMPLVKKYPDKVRWVMKHYPMNADCNPRMGGERMHPDACSAAFGSHCAGAQGKFWEMHDKLYEDQKKLDAASVRSHAEALGLDMAAFDACLQSGDTRKKILDDIKLAGQAYIYGTPRAYVNGRLVSGSASSTILDYYIQKSLEETSKDAPAQAAPAVVEQKGSMIRAKTAQGDFWIDAHEAAITKDGKAVSLAGVDPAQASWYTAKEACEKAGKRLCTEEEWVSACAGEPAVDNNRNGFFADDEVEGTMYPYGLFYEAGTCRDAEDEYKGEPGKTGGHPECKTPTGVYDLAGNLGEWVNPDEAKAVVLGGDWRGGERASCDRRSTTFGAGQANNTLGFRCCADQMVDQGNVTAADLATNVAADVGHKVPSFELELSGGGTFSSKQIMGKVTYLTFYASWCGSCKRELPELNAWHEQYKDEGLQIIAVGVDKNEKLSEDFAAKFHPLYPVGLDPKAKVMGQFDINAMPTSYIIDRSGVIRYKEVGFKQDEVHLVKTRVETLLRAK